MPVSVRPSTVMMATFSVWAGLVVLGGGSCKRGVGVLGEEGWEGLTVEVGI